MRPDTPVGALTARTVHAHIAQRLANGLGGTLEAETDAAAGEVRLAVILAVE